ncbi:putative lipid II flippase FtsW [Ruminococcaceae bacterium OttesenSCG-928-N02]|nr:putative lipid II flippase FtsW [Ruminococcaceae bacterium OttesenSCG-928-N02]
MDYAFLVIVLTLVVFGLIMLFSASYATAYYRFNQDSFHYIRSQLIYAVAGVVVMLVVSRVDYHLLKPFAWPLMGVTFILLVVVLFMQELNHAHRWIFVFGITFQPSEIAKFAVILLFAYIISNNHAQMRSKNLGESFVYGVLPFGVILLGITGLMLLEPHLSGTILILAIGAVMMFVGGTSIKWFATAGVSAAALLAAAVLFKEDLVPYAMDRINVWRDPFIDPLGDGHQTIQSLLAIGSGGLSGLGLGNSRQKHLYVPEPQNDFIFSIICEELGFIGAVLIILLFVSLLLRGLYIAIQARDKFGAMLVVGITTQVTLQAVLNMAVVTNTIPNTGISLPFFSHGGTSLLLLLFEMGVILSVSRQAKLTKL